MLQPALNLLSFLWLSTGDCHSNGLRRNLLHRQHSLGTTATSLSTIQLDTLQVILGRGCTFEITATRLSAIQIDALLTILVILDGWSETIGTSLSGGQVSSYWQGLYPLWMLLLLLPPLPNFIVIFTLC